MSRSLKPSNANFRGDRIFCWIAFIGFLIGAAGEFSFGQRTDAVGCLCV